VPAQFAAGFGGGGGGASDLTGTGDLGARILATVPGDQQAPLRRLIPAIVQGIHEALSIAIGPPFWIGIAGALVAAVFVLFLKRGADAHDVRLRGGDSGRGGRLGSQQEGVPMSIAEAVANASRYLTEHPDEARYRDSAATARLLGGLRVEISGADGASLQTDMPTGIGGTATAPSPWVFRARRHPAWLRSSPSGGPLSALNCRPSKCRSTANPTIAASSVLDDSIPAGPLSTRHRRRCLAPGRSPEEVEALVHWAVEHCPVSDAIKRPVRSRSRSRVGDALTPQPQAVFTNGAMRAQRAGCRIGARRSVFELLATKHEHRWDAPRRRSGETGPGSVDD